MHMCVRLRSFELALLLLLINSNQSQIVMLLLWENFVRLLCVITSLNRTFLSIQSKLLEMATKKIEIDDNLSVDPINSIKFDYCIK